MRERNIWKPQEVTAVTLGIGEEAVVNTKHVSCAVVHIESFVIL